MAEIGLWCSGPYWMTFLPTPSLAPDLFSSVAPPETLMDTKWVTSELAWTSHPESGVRRLSLPLVFLASILLAFPGLEKGSFSRCLSISTPAARPSFSPVTCLLCLMGHLCGHFYLLPSACLCPSPIHVILVPFPVYPASFLLGPLGRALAWEPGNLESRPLTRSVTLSKAVYVSGPPFLDLNSCSPNISEIL